LRVYQRWLDRQLWWAWKLPSSILATMARPQNLRRYS
jgi:hypothetical protein